MLSWLGYLLGGNEIVFITHCISTGKEPVKFSGNPDLSKTPLDR